MRIHRATLEDCEKESDTVVVIDVLRAFTTSAFAFAQGAYEIALVSTVEDAFRLKDEFPDSLIMGEVKGHPVDGFDFGNSPAALLGVDLTGRRLIQRTSAGTQGVVRSRARNILTTGLCTLTGTLTLLKKLNPESVTLVQTGVFPGGRGDEDVACADLIEARLRGGSADLDSIRNRVRDSVDASFHLDSNFKSFPFSDLTMSMEIDRFDFGMMVQAEDGLLLLRQVS